MKIDTSPFIITAIMISFLFAGVMLFPMNPILGGIVMGIAALCLLVIVVVNLIPE